MDTISADFSRAREVYELLQELDRHIGAQDASGRALLYRAKEGLPAADDQHRSAPGTRPPAVGFVPLHGHGIERQITVIA